MDKSVNWANVFVNATEEVTNYSRLLGLLIEEGTPCLQEYMLAHLPHEYVTLEDSIKANESRLKALQKRGVLNKIQAAILFPNFVAPLNYADVDLSLWYILITNLSSGLSRRQWSRIEHKKQLLSTDIKAEHDIVRLRTLRNTICHLSPPQISNEMYAQQWNELKTILFRLGTSERTIAEYALKVPDHKKTLNYIIEMKEEMHKDIELSFKNELRKRKQMMWGLALVSLLICIAALTICAVMYVYSRTWSSCLHNVEIKVTKDNATALSYISREGWGAAEWKHKLTKLKKHRPYVVIDHSAATGACTTTDDCCNTMQIVQKMGFSKGWFDIAYNFLIGNDGVVYEGRGKGREPATALHWNYQIIGLAFIGLYDKTLPSDNALYAAKAFLQYLVDHEVLTHNFTLYGLCQIRPFPTAPGLPIYEEIKNWKGHGKENPWSWREYTGVNASQFGCEANPSSGASANYAFDHDRLDSMARVNSWPPCDQTPPRDPTMADDIRLPQMSRYAKVSRDRNDKSRDDDESSRDKHIRRYSPVN